MAIFLCTDWLSVANKEPGDYDQFTTLLTQCGEFKTFFLSEKKEGDGFMWGCGVVKKSAAGPKHRFASLRE